MGLVLTGGTTITSGQPVTVASWTYTEGAGSNPTHSTPARNVKCDALVDLIDVGGAGVLQIWTAAFATKLAEFALPATAFGAASTGTATANAITGVNALASGTAAAYRVLNGAATNVYESTTVS